MYYSIIQYSQKRSLTHCYKYPRMHYRQYAYRGSIENWQCGGMGWIPAVSCQHLLVLYNSTVLLDRQLLIQVESTECTTPSTIDISCRDVGSHRVHFELVFYSPNLCSCAALQTTQSSAVSRSGRTSARLLDFLCFCS